MRKAANPTIREAKEDIYNLVKALEPGRVPVTTQTLRRRLPGLTKQEFDSAAMELRRDRLVSLSLHHDPHNLSERDREYLIDGQDGNYYVAVAVTVTDSPYQTLSRGSKRAPKPATTPTSSASPLTAQKMVLTAIRRAEPVPGVPVTIQTLRPRVPGLTKQEFDSAVLELRREGRVDLTRYSGGGYGLGLSNNERDMMVSSPGGDYYMAVALRG